MFGQNSSIVVVFVDRNRLQFYGSGLSSILVLDIPTTIVRDLDVVNRDALYTLVNQWLKQNNLGGSQLFFILAPDTYFEKSLITKGESEQETEILHFYDSVPFEELTTKVLTFENGKRAFAINKEYLEAIRHAFLIQGHRVVVAVPALALGTLAAKRWLDAEMGSYVLKHADMLQEYNVVDFEEQNQAATAPASAVPTTKTNPRLMIMVGILGVLLLVLILFIFTRH
jgi:hypothetical protein